MKPLPAALLLFVSLCVLAPFSRGEGPDEPGTIDDRSNEPRTIDDRSSPPTAKAPEKTTATATTQSSQASEFPSPAELIKRMKEMRAKQDQLARVAFFDLSRPVQEKPMDFSLFGDDGSLTLRTLIDRLHSARDDKDIRGVLITLGQHGLNFSQAQEVRDALEEIGKAGKATVVYADGYDTVGYTIASGAKKVCLLQGGEIMIPGVGLESTFAKGLLDKIGVKADYVQIGEYKGADEPYTRKEASEELRGELNRLTDSLYAQIVDGISTHRHLPRETVRAMIDESILTAPNAKSLGFVDELIDQDGLRPLLTKELGRDIDLLHDFGRPQREPIDLSSPFGFFSMLTRKPEVSEKPAVAIIYANGVIVDGEAEGGLFSEGGVGSEAMRRAFRTAARDERIKAVVVRIDSPGGSALASEVMWQAARHCAEKKPVIISVGSMAASGGYYLASAGDYIFADSSAIVGSIGVVGGKFVVKDLFDKLGITTESFDRGKNADLFSSNQPFSDRQRQMVTSWMRQTYEQFTQRVMKTRTGKIKDIDKVARGRIFLARQAKDLGMVDEIGGVEDAIAYAAKGAKLEPGTYDVRVVPAPKTLADIFGGGGSGGADAAAAFRPKVELGSDSLLKALSPALRKPVEQQLRMLQMLQDRPVALMAPYVVTIK